MVSRLTGYHFFWLIGDHRCTIIEYGNKGSVMPTPASADFDVWQGNTSEIALKLKTSETTYLDLTGSTFFFKMQWKVGGATQTLVLSIGNGIVITDAAEGYLTITITTAQSRTLLKGRTVKYELERRIDGKEITLLAGFLRVVEWVNDDA